MTEKLEAPCKDCRGETLFGPRAEWYMVHNHVWRAAKMTDKPGSFTHFLCIGCLESRLGRQLTAADFTDAPVNEVSHADNPRYAFTFRSPRLIDRLTKVGADAQTALWPQVPRSPTA